MRLPGYDPAGLGGLEGLLHCYANGYSTMQAVETQFRSALAFAYTWIIARVLGTSLLGKDVDVIAVVCTYLLIAIVALGMRQLMISAKDRTIARTVGFVVLGALCATAPEFW